MQHGLHNTIELMRIESELLDRELKYHYLVADERLRYSRGSAFREIIERLRSFLAPRPMVPHERGI